VAYSDVGQTCVGWIMDARFPTVGPGQTEVCKECVEQQKRKYEYACMIADHVEQHPEIMNGDKYLHDLVKLRRGQR